MNGDPIYRRGDALWRRTFDRVVLLVPPSEDFVTLTATGCDLWTVLAEPGSITQLADRLATLYPAPVGRIAGDIPPVIEDLVRCGALTVTYRER